MGTERPSQLEEGGMSKLGMLAAGAVGYVLGARAGRERYEQIMSVAGRVWSSPQVQRAATDAQDRAREAAPIVAEKVADAAKHAAGAAVHAVRGGSDESSPPMQRHASSSASSASAPRPEATDGIETKVSHL
jgi:hypothetical protein